MDNALERARKALDSLVYLDGEAAGTQGQQMQG